MTALKDESASVAVIAAQALGQYGSNADSKRALTLLTDKANGQTNGVYIGMLALNALDAMDARAASARDTIGALPQNDPQADRRMGAYLKNLITKTVSDLGGKVPQPRKGNRNKKKRNKK